MRRSSTGLPRRPQITYATGTGWRERSPDRPPTRTPSKLTPPCKPRCSHTASPKVIFVDGNKRLALVAMLTFLEINGYRVDTSDPELAESILDLASGTAPEELAARIRTTLIPTRRT